MSGHLDSQLRHQAVQRAVALGRGTDPAALPELTRLYEQRMSSLITHPLFDYKVSYRRALELQARILAKTLTGEIPEYMPLLTRWPMRTTCLVCYDVADDKRLRRAFKTCRNYGDHLQYSVFECDLNPSEKIQLEDALSQIINHGEDQVLFVALGPAQGRGDRVITALGLPYTKLDAPCYVV